jgi:hypothetical protein
MWASVFPVRGSERYRAVSLDPAPICGSASKPIMTCPKCGKTRSASRATGGPHRSPLRVGATPTTKLWVRTTRLVVPAGRCADRGRQIWESWISRIRPTLFIVSMSCPVRCSFFSAAVASCVNRVSVSLCIEASGSADWVRGSMRSSNVTAFSLLFNQFCREQPCLALPCCKEVRSV